MKRYAMLSCYVAQWTCIRVPARKPVLPFKANASKIQGKFNFINRNKLFT